MTTMKKRTALAVTAGVWVAALMCAAGLMYELNRPLRDVGNGASALSPFAGALLAISWLAIVSGFFWALRKAQVDRASRR